MKTFSIFKEDLKKSLSPLKDFGKSFAGQAEKFAKSKEAENLKNDALKFMFSKFDQAVEGGIEKYNEIKNKVNK